MVLKISNKVDVDIQSVLISFFKHIIRDDHWKLEILNKMTWNMKCSFTLSILIAENQSANLKNRL